MSGCPVHELRAKLRHSGLRPTRQRVALGWLLFAKGDRHITAEKLYEEATGLRVTISLATVYNTLHQFLIEETNQLVDIPDNLVSILNLPDPLEGMEISSVDVVVRLRKKA